MQGKIKQRKYVFYPLLVLFFLFLAGSSLISQKNKIKKKYTQKVITTRSLTVSLKPFNAPEQVFKPIIIRTLSLKVSLKPFLAPAQVFKPKIIRTLSLTVSLKEK